jgi:DNA-binding response OmpR family regulator
MRILLVEDDEILAELLRDKLVAQQYVVDVAHDGEEAWGLITSLNYDLIVLDIVLPKLNGITLCRRLRAKGSQSLVLLLTAKETLNDKIMGLDAGADDYLVKPMPMPELVARIKALLRRRMATVSPVLEWGVLRLNVDSRKVSYGDRPLALTAKEYALLELFLRNPQQIFSQGAILSQLWSFEVDPPGEETVRAHVKRLRQKLKTVGAEELVETVYGMGYRLNQAVKDVQPKPMLNLDRQSLEVPDDSSEERIENAKGNGDIYSEVLEQGAEFLLKKSALTRVLIIDRNQDFIDRFIHEAGVRDMQTAIALTIHAAQDSIQRVRPDGVVIDLSQFEVEEGLKLLEELGQSAQPVPVLVLTDPYQAVDRVAIARRRSR